MNARKPVNKKPRAHGDFETRSVEDLTDTGVHKYALDKHTGVWCLCYQIGSDEIQTWIPGDKDPTKLLDHIDNGHTFVAHNAAFERIIWNLLLRRRDWAHWPEMRISQVSCTMARAQSLAFPGKLDTLAKALRLGVEKDMVGNRLMKKMMRPRRFNDGGEPVWWDAPDLVARLIEYCKQDVRTECAADVKLAELHPRERALYDIDQVINDRGVRVDVESVRLAEQLVIEAKAVYNLELDFLTDGALDSADATAQIREWLRANGHPECVSIAKAALEALLLIAEGKAKRVLEIRKAAGKSSVAKLPAMLLSADFHDDRARGLFTFSAATTHRWGGRRVQTQNLPRPTMKLRNIEEVVALLTHPEAAEAIELIYGDLIDVCAGMLRSMFIAADGHDFVCADYANIEGRVLAWLAGEEWKIQAFKEFDAGIGFDLYILAYAKAFGLDPSTISKEDFRRQVGKVMELALGYQGGFGAFKSMAANYGLIVLDAGQETTDPAVLTYRQVQDIKKGWRLAHPAVTSLWKEIEAVAIEAVKNPGQVFSLENGKIKYVVNNDILYCRLPNGTTIDYPEPKMGRTTIKFIDDETGETKTYTKDCILFMGLDTYTKQWSVQKTYGGSLTENVVQKIARDIEGEAMLRCEAAGYPIVMHTHDELVAEIPTAFGSKEEFAAIMCDNEPWTWGLPVVAPEPWRGERYRK